MYKEKNKLFKPETSFVIFLNIATMKKLFIPVFCMFLLSNCNREAYKTVDYNTLTRSHQVLAILPVETITTGRIQAELDQSAIDEIEEAESLAFQISLYNQLSRRSGTTSGDIRVNFQHYSQTNAYLEEAGIDIREAWNRPPLELADLLNVDAVVRTTVQKEQYLTDLESFGVAVATTIVALFSDSYWPWAAHNRARTSDVLVSCSVLESTQGIAVWSTSKEKPTFWNRNHREVVDEITRALARRFPYRF